MPALFVHVRCDAVRDTAFSATADPMRRVCAELTEITLDGGHRIRAIVPSVGKRPG
jgi:hypothetical protein